MKRDNDLIRQILLDTERQKDWLIFVLKDLAPSDDDRKSGYHVHLLTDAGLMTQISDSGFRMTNQGHDYLDAIRSDTIWNKTKTGAAKLSGTTLGMMKDIAIAYLKQEAAVKLGIEL